MPIILKLDGSMPPSRFTYRHTYVAKQFTPEGSNLGSNSRLGAYPRVARLDQRHICPGKTRSDASRSVSRKIKNPAAELMEWRCLRESDGTRESLDVGCSHQRSLNTVSILCPLALYISCHNAPFQHQMLIPFIYIATQGFSCDLGFARPH